MTGNWTACAVLALGLALQGCAWNGLDGSEDEDLPPVDVAIPEEQGDYPAASVEQGDVDVDVQEGLGAPPERLEPTEQSVIAVPDTEPGEPG